MFGRGRRWAQTALAAVAGGALLLGSAGPAAADPPASGIPSRMQDGVSIPLLMDGKTKTFSGINLTITGQPAVPVFCIDYHTGLGAGEVYNEGTWSESEVKDLGKVQWVLAHGYPNGATDQLLSAAGVQLPQVDAARGRKLLYFGTQTAVWHFSDGVTLGDWKKGAGLGDKAQYAVVKKIYDYLTTHAVSQPEPAAQLTVSPATATAVAGQKAGPFTVAGPAGAIAVSVTGGSAVDAADKPVTSTTNGGQFWLTSPAAGKATATVTAEDSVSFGRVFLYSGGKAKRQKLILGSSVGKTVTASAAADFTPVTTPTATTSATPTATASSPAATSSPTPTATSSTPAPSATSSAPASPSAEVPAPSTSPSSDAGLPVTGSSTGPVLAGGIALLVAGGVALMIVRRRRVRFTS